MNLPAKFESVALPVPEIIASTLCSPWSPKVVILVPIESAYDFLLVRNSNLGPILHHFGDIAGFFCAPE